MTSSTSSSDSAGTEFDDEFDGDVPPEFDDGTTVRDPAVADDGTPLLLSLGRIFKDRYPQAPAPYNDIVMTTTQTYLKSLDPADPPEPRVVEQHLLHLVNTLLKAENAKSAKGEPTHPYLRMLTNLQIAWTLQRLHHVVLVAPSMMSHSREHDILAMYVAAGPRTGIHTTSEDEMRHVARCYNGSLTKRDWEEITQILHEDSERVQRCPERDLIALDNGVFFYGSRDRDLTLNGTRFHFTAKSLHRFDPAIILLSKPPVAWNPDAAPVTIAQPDGSTWEMGAWLADLFEDADQTGMETLLWQIIGAVLRPRVRWGKSVWFYSESGNNGKGTICQILRNLLGPEACASVPIDEMGKDFALEPLLSALAIVVDENDVGAFIDRAANIKAIQTNDVIEVNRKHRIPVAFQFWGLMVQCLNDMPRFKDKSESFYRRQLFVPFRKSFTGAENKAIKDDYLQRPEVLEWIVRHVLSEIPDYYEFNEPPATHELLAEYKENNDPVRFFWETFRLDFVWDLIPFVFAYSLFKAWFAKVSPSGKTLSAQQFNRDLVAVIGSDPDWSCADRRRKIRPGSMMDAPEPLIAEYELKDWYTPGYTGDDPIQRSRPHIKPGYYGLLRTVHDDSGADDGDEQD